MARRQRGPALRFKEDRTIPPTRTTRKEARRRVDVEHAARRNAEAACRLDFRVYGDGIEGRVLGHVVRPVLHSERCICSPPCSFTYDPLPYPEAEPVDLRLYAGTGIGALYGVPGSEDITAELGGWTLTPRSERYE